MKQCGQCQQRFSLDLFYKDSSRTDGKMRICKQCSSDNCKKYQQNNSHKRKEYRQSVKDHSEIVRSARLNKLKDDKEEYIIYLMKERNRHLKYKYNIDQDIYNKMRQDQECKCAICGVHENEAPRGSSGCAATALYVDHCHKTGNVRKLLCMFCNSLLGKAKESTETLQKAIDYLDKFNN